MARSESVEGDHDPSRREFFRTFSRETVRQAGAVAGAAAELRRADSELLSRVVSLIERPTSAPNLPLDPQGSGFEQRVWRALQEIPAGSTVGYGELAARIGAPGAAKEVGEACAANRLAVAIPCHRVIRKDGGLAGYRWGVQRKRALLEREKGQP